MPLTTIHNYKLDLVTSPQHVVTLSLPWRELPIVLENIRSVPMNIRRAHISKDACTLYLKEVHQPVCSDMDGRLAVALDVSNVDEYSMHMLVQTPRMRLPLDTQILLYNIPHLPHCTVMEFGCHDRVGLLSDLLRFIEPLSVEIVESHITTVGSFAHNIIHLSKDGRALSDEYISFMRNVFEYEGKERVDPTQCMM